MVEEPGHSRILEEEEEPQTPAIAIGHQEETPMLRLGTRLADKNEGDITDKEEDNDEANVDDAEEELQSND